MLGILPFDFVAGFDFSDSVHAFQNVSCFPFDVLGFPSFARNTSNFQPLDDSNHSLSGFLKFTVFGQPCTVLIDFSHNNHTKNVSFSLKKYLSQLKIFNFQKTFFVFFKIILCDEKIKVEKKIESS